MQKKTQTDFSMNTRLDGGVKNKHTLHTIKPVLALNVTLFSMETSAIDKQKQKHNMNVKQHCIIPGNKKFYLGVIAWAATRKSSFVSVQKKPGANFKTVHSLSRDLIPLIMCLCQYWPTVFRYHCPCNHRRMTKHISFIPLI